MMSPTPTTRVRRAEVGDAAAVARTMATPRALAGTLQLPYPSASMWEKRIGELPADDHLLVAEAGGEVVGNAGLHRAGRSPRRRHAGIIGMSVRDDWHGRGVGSALLAAVIDLAENWAGYTRLELIVYADNAAALALYRKFGFTVEGTLRNYALRDGDYVDAYAMARFALSKPLRTGDAATTKDGET
ncbi:MAG: GNAT family N-acetyltransferase [Casimicrobiaceae bacterium]